MPALVMSDLNGGDYTFCVVDDELWDQIIGISPDDMPGDDDQERGEAWCDVIGWLTLPEEDQGDRPVYVPVRVGKVLATYHSQAGVVEATDIGAPLRGILTLRC